MNEWDDCWQTGAKSYEVNLDHITLIIWSLKNWMRNGFVEFTWKSLKSEHSAWLCWDLFWSSRGDYWRHYL